MSDASKKLAQSRQAILQHIARKQRRHDPRETTEQGYPLTADDDGPRYEEDRPAVGGGWFRHVKHAVRTWWRYHPAHMAVDLASPLMRGYARRKPVQLLVISLAAGAALTFARPWRVISITTLLIAVLKSSQLSSLFMAAMSAADYQKDNSRP